MKKQIKEQNRARALVVFFITISVLGIIFVILCIVNHQVSSSSLNFKSVRRFYTASRDKIIGGEKDEHGCLGPAGYSWCEAKEKCLRPWEEGCEDYVLKVFEDIETETGIDFPDPNIAEFTWQVESEEGVDTLKLNGFFSNVYNVSEENFQKIKDYMESDGFKEDLYNGRGSFFGEQVSYRKDGFSLVCDLSGIASDFVLSDPKYEPQTTDKNVSLTCGILEKDLIPQISSEKRIREVFAKRHGVKIFQVEILLAEEKEDYALGSVRILPNESENMEMFLASKFFGEWQIAYVGNESVSCDELELYNFPKEMIEGICY